MQLYMRSLVVLVALAPALTSAQDAPLCEALRASGDEERTVFERCIFNVEGTGFQLFYNTSDGIFKALVRKQLPDSRRGWLAFGVTPNPGRMLGGVATVGHQDFQENVIIKQFQMKQKNGADLEKTVGPDYQDLNVAVSEYFFADGVNNLYFERPIKGKDDFDFVLDMNPEGQTDVILACGDMETGDGDPTGQTVKGFGHFMERVAVKAFLDDGAFVHQTNEFVAAHAALMGISWGILVPFSFLIARYSKNECHPMWFYLHRGMNTVAICMMIAGWGIGIYFGSGRYPDHLGIGTTAVILAILQPVNAYFRPRKTHGDSSSKKRHYWEMLHFWTGRIAWVLAIVNMAIGFTLFGVDLLWTVVLWVAAGIVVLPNICLEIRGYQKIRPIRIAQEKLSVSEVRDSEVRPLVFKDSLFKTSVAGERTMTGTHDNLESMRLDLVEDPNYKEPSHRESMRNDLLTVSGSDGKIRRWSYIR